VNTLAASDEGEAAGGSAQLTVEAVMLYEGFSTGLRGKGVLDCVAHLFSESPHFNLAV
jgi:hypothetical protein